MISRSETGHAVNVANFETLISFCRAYESAYNPVSESLKLHALEELLEKTQTMLSESAKAKNQFDLAVNRRQIKFKQLKPTATRVVSALGVTGASAQTVEDAKSINAKIQGKRSSLKPKEGEEKRVISVSQQSFNSRLDNL